MPFVIQGLDLIFCSFLVDFLIGACLSRVLLKSRKKVSKPKCISLFSVTKFQFISCRSLFETVNIKISKVSVGSTYSLSLQVAQIPLKFSRMINWGRWSEIKVVMLPERYLKDGLFTKMLFLSVANFSLTLVGSIICGVNLQLKSNSRKLYVPLFYYY